MRSYKNNQLLDDVIETEELKRFREEIFSRGLGVIKAKQRRRYHWWGIAAAVAVLGIAIVILSGKPEEQPRGGIAEEGAVARPRVNVVSTRPIDPTIVVRSVPNRALVITTAGSYFARKPAAVSDEELVALFAERGAGFIGSGSNRFFVVSRPDPEGSIE
jgi:hypothetical protein